MIHFVMNVARSLCLIACGLRFPDNCLRINLFTKVLKQSGFYEGVVKETGSMGQEMRRKMMCS
jgi:hypothetical protein